MLIFKIFSSIFRFSRFACLLISLLAFNYSDACHRKRPKGQSQPKQDTPNDNPNDAVKDQLGDIKTKPFAACGFDEKNGIASSQEDLKCDFEAECKCCWKNSKPPYDTLDYASASGNPDSEKLSKYFKTSTPPSGTFLLTSTNKPANPDDKAELETCIICSSSEIKVTLKHWSTEGVKFQICQTKKDDPNSVINCQDVPNSSPGPDTVTLPAGNDINIVIAAKNFVGSKGSIAMLDDISVEYTPCSGSTTPPLEPTTPPGVVTTVAPLVETPPPPTQAAADDSNSFCCRFDQGTCGYKRGGGPQNAKGQTNDYVQAGPKYFRNLATGVPPSKDSAFSAAYLKQGENCYMETEGSMPTKRTIKFQEFKATQDIVTKVCCDTEDNCPYGTKPQTSKGDFRQWYQGAIECPAGTKKILFYGENTGKNEGGVGIDNIEVFDENGNQIC